MAVGNDKGGNVRGDVGRVAGDIGGDTRWLSYEELALARGVKVPAAVRLVQRRGWERQEANDGSARVAVPVAELRPSRAVAPVVTLVAPDSRDAEALARERLRADQAEARAVAAEAREAAARAQADHRGEALTAALVAAASAQGEAVALREALTEARRPAWRRMLGLP